MKIPVVLFTLLTVTVITSITAAKSEGKNHLSASASRHNGRYSRNQKKKPRKNTPDDYHYEYETKPESYSRSREFKSKPENYHVEIDLPPRSYSTSYHNSKTNRHKDSPSEASYNRRNRGNSYNQNRNQNKNRREKSYDDEGGDDGEGDTEDVDYYDSDVDNGRTRGFSSDTNYNKETKDDYQKSGKLDDDDDSYDNRRRGGGRSYGGQGGRGRSSRHGGGGGGSRNSNSNRHFDDHDDADSDQDRFASVYGDGNAKSYTSASEY